MVLGGVVVVGEVRFGVLLVSCVVAFPLPTSDVATVAFATVACDPRVPSDPLETTSAVDFPYEPIAYVAYIPLLPPPPPPPPFAIPSPPPETPSLAPPLRPPPPPTSTAQYWPFVLPPPF